MLSAILYVVDENGNRVDPPRADGSRAPLILALGEGFLATTAEVSGGLTKVTIAVDGDSLPAGPAGPEGPDGPAATGVVDTEVDTIPQRGPTDAEIKAGYFEADANGPVATQGEFRGPEGCGLIGRVATGGGADAPMALLSSTLLLLSSYQTTPVVRTAANVQFQHGISNTAFGRFVSAAPSQSLDWSIAADGLCWWESSRAVKASRRRVAVTSVAATFNAYDGIVLSVSSAGGSNSVNLPTVDAGESAEVTIITDATGAVNVATDGSDVFRVNGTVSFTQLDTLAITYRHLGNGSWGIAYQWS